MTIKVDLNQEEKRLNLFDPLAIVLALLVASSGTAFYAYGQTLEQQILRIDQEKSALDTKIKQGETILQAIDQEKQKLAQLDQQLRLTQNLRLDPLKFANIMAEVSQILPEAVYIDSLQIEPGDNHLSLTGTAAGPLPLSTVAATMERLNRSVYFDATSLQNASREGKDYRFSLSAHFDPLAAAERSPGSCD